MRFVTTHAILRWLERVHGLGPDIDRLVSPASSERRRVEIGCDLLGITVAEAEDLVCPPRLHAAMRMGRRAILAAGYRMPVRNGVAITVLTRDMPV